MPVSVAERLEEFYFIAFTNLIIARTSFHDKHALFYFLSYKKNQKFISLRIRETTGCNS
jgi:hypothetical protein